MIVLEYKVKGKNSQYQAIEEAIRTTQFIRNKALRYWIDASKEVKINRFALNKYSTELRDEFKFVKDLNSMAVQSGSERAWTAIKRFYENCKAKVKGKKGYPRFQRDNRSVEYKTSGWALHPSKRQITFTDKKGIGKLKLLGAHKQSRRLPPACNCCERWDIHTYPNKAIKRVRIVRRANGYYCQFCVDIESSNI